MAVLMELKSAVSVMVAYERKANYLYARSRENGAYIFDFN